MQSLNKCIVYELKTVVVHVSKTFHSPLLENQASNIVQEMEFPRKDTWHRGEGWFLCDWTFPGVEENHIQSAVWNVIRVNISNI